MQLVGAGNLPTRKKASGIITTGQRKELLKNTTGI